MGDDRSMGKKEEVSVIGSKRRSQILGSDILSDGFVVAGWLKFWTMEYRAASFFSVVAVR